jgi:hypothetical protein
MAAVKRSSHPYTLHPSVAAVEEWIGALKGRTGRSLDEWFSEIRKHGPKFEKERREWLKSAHGMGTMNAAWLAEKCDNPDKLAEDTPKGYMKIAPMWVDEQYAGKKAALRPVYERLLAPGLSQGKDARACPCKTMVPLYRNHVFAQIKPATNTRIDVGFALAKIPEGKIAKSGGRVIATGGREKKDRITHRIAVTTVDEIDDLVRSWMKRAYELDGE